MSCRSYKRTMVFHNLVVFLLISTTGRLALGQVKSCTEPIPADIARITAALDLCAQVSHVTGPQIGLRAFDYSGTTATEASDKSLIQSRATEELGEIRELSQEVVSMESKNRKATARQTKSMQIAGIVIGMIGGGLGSGLKLISNPQVGHAAYVLGMTAGATGGSLNLTALLTKADTTANLSASVKSFAGASANEVEKDPLSLVLMLTDMKIELAALQSRLR